MMTKTDGLIAVISLCCTCLMFQAGCRSTPEGTGQGVPQQGRNANITQDMVRQVLDNPKLELFLHPEVEGRIPVVLSDHLLASPMDLSKYGQPVRVSADTTPTERAILRFTRLTLGDNNATLEFVYDIEGVYGKCTFARAADGTWLLSAMSVWER